MNNNGLDNAMIPLMPIWDTINELNRLRDLMRFATCITEPLSLKEDHAYEIFHPFILDLCERLDGACEALAAARGNVVFISQTEGGH